VSEGILLLFRKRGGGCGVNNVPSSHVSRAEYEYAALAQVTEMHVLNNATLVQPATKSAQQARYEAVQINHRFAPPHPRVPCTACLTRAETASWACQQCYTLSALFSCMDLISSAL
jgi:hypothetical protein